ncbi:MAG: energy-coupling factor transporter transmembrane component T [Eubacteriales bacterium]|nr:energy-coupling factor transporter transmembrane component T [Eubacteriales bacterium]
MFKDITLGQYFPGDSPVHKLDPRTKIIGMIAFIIIVFFVKKVMMFLPVFLFILIATYLSRVPMSYLWKSLKPLRFILIFMFILNLFVIGTGETLWRLGPLHITTGGIRQAVFITVRLILLVSGTSLLTLTTTPIGLTDGLELLLTPLKKVKFPAHELAMMMTIALRFIPTLMEEADKISSAQISRGADFETGNIVKRAKAMVPVLVPLFISAFRRADELAMAMESRCYHGGEGRTRMHVLRCGRNDFLAACALLLLFAVVLAGGLLL